MPNLIALLGAATALAGAPFALGLQSTLPPARAPAIAPAQTVTILSARERAPVLKSASAALSGVKTARGRFEQVAPDGKLTTGQFAMSRPGKVRFDYDDPVALLLVSDGTTVGLQDADLETTDRVPLAQTPLSLLLSDKLDFEKDAEITDVRRNGSQLAISLRDRTGEMDGTLTVFMAASDYALSGWRTVDASGGITSVQLSTVEYGARLNPRLFILRDFDNR